MKLRHSAIAVFLLLASLQLSASDSRSAPGRRGRVALAVSGVRLGSSYSFVKSKLHRPTSDKTILDDTMGSVETVRTLKYPGLTVKFYRVARSKAFEVVTISVDSSRWLVAPGVRVGFTTEQVKAKLGAPLEESDVGGQHRFHYANSGGDGWALFEFQDNKLVAVSWSYDLS
jgi:hypothetical protein